MLGYQCLVIQPLTLVDDKIITNANKELPEVWPEVIALYEFLSDDLCGYNNITEAITFSVLST